MFFASILLYVCVRLFFKIICRFFPVYFVYIFLFLHIFVKNNLLFYTLIFSFYLFLRMIYLFFSVQNIVVSFSFFFCLNFLYLSDFNVPSLFILSIIFYLDLIFPFEFISIIYTSTYFSGIFSSSISIVSFKLIDWFKSIYNLRFEKFSGIES